MLALVLFLLFCDVLLPLEVVEIYFFFFFFNQVQFLLSPEKYLDEASL